MTLETRLYIWNSDAVFEKVIDGGLEEDQINALIVTAMKKNWESTKLNTEIRRQPPIVLEYK